jgi:glycosyltransferase involved in cell wall biosynthesis
VPPKNPAALADKALHLLKNPAQAAVFVAAGQKRIENEFTRAKMLSSIQIIYQSVFDERKQK